VVRAATSFNTHHAGGKLRKELFHRATPKLTLQHNASQSIYPVNLEHVLRQIQTNRANLVHGRLPCLVESTSPVWRIDAVGGRPPHHCEERQRRSNPSLAGLAMDCFASPAMTVGGVRIRATHPPTKLRRFTRKGQMDVAPATKQPDEKIIKKFSSRLPENIIGPDRLFAFSKGRYISNREVFEYPVEVVMARPWSPTSFRKAFHVKGNDDLRWVSVTNALQVFQTTF